MNREEAKRVAQQYLAQFRDVPYDGLRHLMARCPLACDAVGPSGIRYQLELQIQWNDQPNGDLRVVALADDLSLPSSVRPEAVDFIRAPDGTFVGE